MIIARYYTGGYKSVTFLRRDDMKFVQKKEELT